jgi:hypothetical protein
MQMMDPEDCRTGENLGIAARHANHKSDCMNRGSLVVTCF